MIVGYCILNGKKWVMFEDKQCAAGEVKLTDAAKQMVLNRKMYKEIKKMDHQDMSNYLSRYYMNAYNQGKEDSEGLKADELREILLTVKGIGPAKAENIMEAVGKALAEKG